MSDAHAVRIAQLVRRLSAVPDPALLERLAREILSERPIALLADFLSELGRNAREERVRQIYTAIVRLCLGGREPPQDVREAIYSTMAERGDGALARFLLPVPAIRTAADTDAPYDPQLDDMPLGMKKWKARLHDRHLLLRLGREGDPLVLRILLDNPRILEEDVVQWAARRPTPQECIMLIARHRRWALRPKVQEAVTRNPYSPVHVAASYMPVLNSRLLRDIEQDGSLHPLVREAAAENLRVREE